MIVIHHIADQMRPFDNPPVSWAATKCNPDQPARGVQGAYTIGDAIKKLDYSPQSVLCAQCFRVSVGEIKFDTEPSFHEAFTNYLAANNHMIVDAEILEEE